MIADYLTHYFAGGVYAKETRIPAGTVLVQHKHRYDHLSILASGTVVLNVDGVASELTGPACVSIAANKHHGVKALTDAVWFCIHATDAVDSDVADASLSLRGSAQDMQALAEAML